MPKQPNFEVTLIDEIIFENPRKNTDYTLQDFELLIEKNEELSYKLIKSEEDLEYLKERIKKLEKLVSQLGMS